VFFVHLHQTLTIQKRLKSLKLELTGAKVSAFSLSNLFDERFEVLPLVDFSLCLSEFVNLIDEVMKKMVVCLSNISTLRTFCMNLDKCSLSDGSLQEFSLLLNEQSLLNKFSLRVGLSVGQITNKSVLAIAKAVKNAEHLRHFGLEFERKPAINDDALIGLAENLRQIYGLQSIKLSFPGCDKITSRGLAVMGQSLSMMRTLESLTLDLENNPEIDDDGVMALINYLKRIKRLNFFKINLMKGALSRQTVDSLGKYVKSISNAELILNA
jgi:hypothetical protein